MTEKLYYTDSFMTEFDAVVLTCNPCGDSFAVTLNRTAFYPEGGGQPADHGTLGSAQVTDVQEKDGVIVHTCSAPLNIGEKVSGTIDFTRRFRFMQQHSGEHILSGFLHSMYGLENVGFHMGADVVTIDTSAVITADELSAAERAANEYIARNMAVNITFPDEETLKSIPYRSKKELSGDVRIVEFPGADICACCGTHVLQAGQVGFVKILSAASFRSGLRLEILCGLEALKYLSLIHTENSSISQMLSAKPLETSATVSRMQDALAAEKARSAALETQLFALRAQTFRGAGNVLLFEDGLTPDSARRLADAVAGECGGMAAVFTPAEVGFRYAVAEREADLRDFARELNSALNGRGGGRGGLIQGSVGADKAAVEHFFAQNKI